MSEKAIEVLKVKNSSNVQKLAGAIANIAQRKDECELVSIGAGAVNQATKAIIIARRMVAPLGINLLVIPAFVTLNLSEEGGKEEVTAIKHILRYE
jgi:stage V sporulation protein S